MSHSIQEASAFLNASLFSLQKFFEVLAVRADALAAIDIDIDHCRKLQEADHRWFVDEGQFESDSNHEFAQHMRRMEQFKAAEQAAPKRLAELLARRGATEIAMGIAAGSVLQLGKQVLSYRFGDRVNVPTNTARQVGKQAVTTLIWEGRNHALHWEEPTPKTRVVAMFSMLAEDGRLRRAGDRNYAPELLDILGWSGAALVLSDLEAIIRLA
jgi:hypothetical protein